MSCYGGETVSIGITLPSWHDVESFYDSQDGQSPLMQLCRACREIYLSIAAPSLSFTRVGPNPADVAWAAVPYASTPAWNPLRDHETILTEINTRLILITQPNANFVNSSTCVRWRFSPQNPVLCHPAQYSLRFARARVALVDQLIESF